MLTEVGMFVLRSLCCRCKRNDVTPRSKAQRNNDALIKPEDEDVSVLALQITKNELGPFWNGEGLLTPELPISGRTRSVRMPLKSCDSTYR